VSRLGVSQPNGRLWRADERTHQSLDWRVDTFGRDLFSNVAVALSLCVVGLAIISVWWSWLFIAAMLESVRDWKLVLQNEVAVSATLLSDISTEHPTAHSG
jgi:hypothetical protein